MKIQKNLLEARKQAIGPDVPTDREFMRKGQVGSWRKEMSLELALKVDEWMKKNIKGTDFDKWQDIYENSS